MKIVLASLAAVAGAAKVSQNPLGKVVDLLSQLAADVQKDGEREAKTYKEFFEWCDDASRNAGFAIDTASKQKAKLEATISKLVANIEASTSKIDGLAQKIATGEKNYQDAKGIREQERKDFLANEKELMEVVDTLGRAVGVLEKEMAKGSSFAQIDSSSVSATIEALSTVLGAASFTNADQQKLASLLQARTEDDSDAGAPAAAVYTSKSGGIVEVLEDMRDKAQGQLDTLRKEEVNSQHNYDMLQQSTQDQLDEDKKTMAATKADRSDAEEGKSDAESDLKVATSDLQESQAQREKAHENCLTTAADHEATVAARNEELKVIADAKKLLQDTSSGAVSQTYTFLQLGIAAAASKSRSAEIVRQLGLKYHSAALTQLASRMNTEIRMGATLGDDPFAKVKGLITGMITKLKKEMGDEATEKAYCDEQMSKTEEKKADLEAAVSKLTSKIDRNSARSTELKAQVSELQKQLSALAKEQAEMDRIRQESNADFKAAKADLELGLSGVRKALGVLRDYYGGAAASLIQDQSMSSIMQPASPEKHSKAGGAASSIIGILEVVESDFAKNLAKEETEEEDSADEYEKTTQENKITRTEKEQAVKYKSKESVNLDKTISEQSADRDTENTELSAVLEYYAKIKERCIAKPETYEERKARRDAEIAGLKEAMTVLEEETAGAFMQRKRKGNMRGATLSTE